MAGQDGPYIRRMLRGIVAFEMPITRLEAKAKLSQNKTEDDRQGVIAALEAGDRPGDLELAAAMRRLADD
jgi:transcriptional regulator